MHIAEIFNSDICNISEYPGSLCFLSEPSKANRLKEFKLRYLFGIAYGISPHAYLIETRVSAAKEMLWNSDIPITEIAEKCGFGRQQYLNDIFKKATGMSPGKYREQFAKKYTE